MKFMIAATVMALSFAAQAATHPTSDYSPKDDPNRKPKSVRKNAENCPYQHRGHKSLLSNTSVAATQSATNTINK